MTLDAALFLLKNADGEHRFSTDFTVDEGGLGGGRAAAAATEAFTEVLARAIAAVPMRILGSLIPGGEEEDEEKVRKTWTLAFAPGATETGHAPSAALDEAASLLGDDDTNVLALRHELAAQDAETAERRANPSEETCLEFARGLRRRKAWLLRRHREVATDAHALHPIGDARAREAGDTLRAFDRELASIEASLDRLFEVIRSDSPRQRTKRTRSVAREIAELRLANVAAELERRIDEDEAERVETRAPRFDVVPGEGGGRIVIELRRR